MNFGFTRINFWALAIGVVVLVAVSGLVLAIKAQGWKQEIESVKVIMVEDMFKLIVETEQNIAILQERQDVVEAKVASLEKGYSSQLNNLANELAFVTDRLGKIAIDSETIGKNKAELVAIGRELAEIKQSITSISNRIRNLEEYYYDIEGRIAYNNAENGFVAEAWQDVWGNTIVGQQFSTGNNVATLKDIRLYSTKRIGLPSSVEIAVYALDKNGLPLGNPIAGLSVDASDWVIGPEWHTFNIAGKELATNTMYCFVVSDIDGDPQNCIAVAYDNQSQYATDFIQSVDGGATWGTVGYIDLGFEVWGTRR